MKKYAIAIIAEKENYYRYFEFDSFPNFDDVEEEFWLYLSDGGI